jgi:hypothetical protein
VKWFTHKLNKHEVERGVEAMEKLLNDIEVLKRNKILTEHDSYYFSALIKEDYETAKELVCSLMKMIEKGAA